MNGRRKSSGLHEETEIYVRQIIIEMSEEKEVYKKVELTLLLLKNLVQCKKAYKIHYILLNEDMEF